MQRELLRVAVLSVASPWRDAAAVLVSEVNGVQYVGSASTTGALARLAPMPDAIVCDAPDDVAIETLLESDVLELPFLILTDEVDHETALRVLRAGGVALLQRHPTADQLATALHAAVDGLCVLSPAHATTLTDPAADTPRSAEWIQPLTPRELQILRMLSEGLPNRTIAAQLEISEHTAKFHVGQILAKLDAESRTEAVTIGIRHGLIMV